MLHTTHCRMANVLFTGGHSNQPYTQKPIYYNFFADHIWSLLLCSPVRTLLIWCCVPVQHQPVGMYYPSPEQKSSIDPWCDQDPICCYERSATLSSIFKGITGFTETGTGTLTFELEQIPIQSAFGCSLRSSMFFVRLFELTNHKRTLPTPWRNLFCATTTTTTKDAGISASIWHVFVRPFAPTNHKKTIFHTTPHYILCHHHNMLYDNESGRPPLRSLQKYMNIIITLLNLSIASVYN